MAGPSCRPARPAPLLSGTGWATGWAGCCHIPTALGRVRHTSAYSNWARTTSSAGLLISRCWASPSQLRTGERILLRADGIRKPGTGPLLTPAPVHSRRPGARVGPPSSAIALSAVYAGRCRAHGQHRLQLPSITSSTRSRKHADFRSDDPLDGAGISSQTPGPDDVARHAPAHGAGALGGAHADDGAGNGVGGGHRHAQEGGQEQRQRATAFGAEPADGLELGDLLAHGLDDAPAAEHGAQADGQVAADDGPIQRGGSDPSAAWHSAVADAAAARLMRDGSLRIVAAVAQAVGAGRDQLQPAKPAVHPVGHRTPKDPGHQHHHQRAQQIAQQGRDEDEGHGLPDAAGDQRARTGLAIHGTQIAQPI
ncbi:hypothetical protein FQR65_LT20401 [Abscondita terminalis]|nr:hypothetical protein FQR65_LT20401 [Abscondita terminalis]